MEQRVISSIVISEMGCEKMPRYSFCVERKKKSEKNSGLTLTVKRKTTKKLQNHERFIKWQYSILKKYRMDIVCILWHAVLYHSEGIGCNDPMEDNASTPGEYDVLRKKG